MQSSLVPSAIWVLLENERYLLVLINPKNLVVGVDGFDEDDDDDDDEEYVDNDEGNII